MTNFAEALAAVGDALAALSSAALADDGLRTRDDHEVLSALAAASRVQRGAEAVMIEAVGQLRERDELRPHSDRAATRYGCRNLGELVQRATRVSGRSAEFPGMRAALSAGFVGVDGVIAVASAFRRGGV